MQQIISYIRVSTGKQGRSGLGIEAQRDAIGVRQFHLIQIAAGAENAQIGNDAAARTDERDSFFRGKLSFLIKPFVDGEFVAGAKKRFDGLGRKMAMARADVHDQRIWGGRVVRQRLAKTLVNRAANEMFDDGPMWCRRCDFHMLD